ncbi:2-amino-4-hydroxy-6-hydroxymethyldihydropteridinepyrophosphokinase [hydrothermal vent metagenome]|uniref:2-amino-4-hydroxy-6-hydroxymethyldihydropteridine diphosphokinase n=2 Tax=hydrothermal vent metagenome TaxID=652676 RepID=A0A3B0VGL7_9ZZZZ
MLVENTVYLGIGSNVNKQQNIQSCIDYLQASFKYCIISPTYQSPAFGFAGNDFYNLAIKIKTHFDLHALKEWLMRLEDLHKRDRSQPRYSNRTLDIDILLFNNLIFQDDYITIPRPEIITQAYVLKPLLDISATIKHPQSHKDLLEYWQSLQHKQVWRV